MLYILLPCYNEQASLSLLFNGLAEALEEYHIVAVNDGSEDSTGEVLEELNDEFPLSVLTHKRNRGLSEAIETGLQYVLREGSEGDILVTMDADNTHKPTQVPQIAKPVESGATIGVGSRYTPGGQQSNVPFRRQVLSRGINLLLSPLSGLGVTDMTSGLRAYDIRALNRATDVFGENLIQSDGFAVSAELLIKTCYAVPDPEVIEIPILLDYGVKKGISGMTLWPTILDYLSLIVAVPQWRLAWHRRYRGERR